MPTRSGYPARRYRGCATFRFYVDGGTPVARAGALQLGHPGVRLPAFNGRGHGLLHRLGIGPGKATRDLHRWRVMSGYC